MHAPHIEAVVGGTNAYAFSFIRVHISANRHVRVIYGFEYMFNCVRRKM